MLLIAALFVVSCGDGDDEGGDGEGKAACTEQGAFRCSGDMLQKCDQEEWKNFENCAGKTCNAEQGKCEEGNGGNEGGNEGDNGGSTEPTTDPTTDPTTPESALTCSEMYMCMVDCGQDGACQQGCFDKGDSTSQAQINALIQCLNTCSESSATDDEFQECANSQCATEISNCGLGGGEEPDTNYNSPYGSVSLNFSIDQIANASDGQQSQVGIAQAAFATGTYGNGAMSVTPADAYMIQTNASYNLSSQYGNSIDIQQIPVYVQGNQGVGGNPIVALSIPEEYAAVGTLNSSIYQGAQAQLFVADVNWSTSQISCIHAFGEGDINITNLGDFANHGGIALNGNITLYSPKNYNGNGDISAQLGVPVCNPVQ